MFRCGNSLSGSKAPYGSVGLSAFRRTGIVAVRVFGSDFSVCAMDHTLGSLMDRDFTRNGSSFFLGRCADGSPNIACTLCLPTAPGMWCDMLILSPSAPPCHTRGRSRRSS